MPLWRRSWWTRSPTRSPNPLRNVTLRLGGRGIAEGRHARLLGDLGGDRLGRHRERLGRDRRYSRREGAGGVAHPRITKVAGDSCGRPSAFFSLSPVRAPVASLALPFAFSKAPSPLSWALLFLSTCSFSLLSLGTCTTPFYL